MRFNIVHTFHIAVSPDQRHSTSSARNAAWLSPCVSEPTRSLSGSRKLARKT